MRKIDWLQMGKLEITDIHPFKFQFWVKNPTTKDGDICFGDFLVKGFNFYRNNVLESVTIYADGDYCEVVKADEITASTTD